jgi:hypothetical protein
MVKNARIRAWREEEVTGTATAGRLGCQGHLADKNLTKELA